MPNTPRERLPNDWTLDDGQVIRLITPEQLAKLPKGYPLTCIDGSRVVVGFDKIDGDTRFGYLAYGNLVTNDSGLLDQANEGGGERVVSGSAAPSDAAMTGNEPAVLVATVPDPAPASVEGVIESIMQPVFAASATGGGLSYQYRHMVAVPDDWPIGTRVRITRISE